MSPPGSNDDAGNLDIIKEYVQSAKSFVQLSSAGLVVPLAFRVKVLGIPEGGQRFDKFELVAMCALWAFFLVAIGTGVFYQYIAIKFVEYRRSPHETYVPALLRPIVEEYGPGTVYGVMVVTFYCGALCVVLYSFAMIAR